MGKPTVINLNDTTPAAPGGKTNVKWQAGSEYALPDGQPVRDVSAYVEAGGGPGGGTNSFLAQTNATANRALDTVYQNTTGHPLLITYTCNFSAVGYANAVAYSDANNPPTTVVAKFYSGYNSVANSGMLYFLVMPNEYYKITQSTFNSAGAWMEYQIVTGTLTRSSNLNGSRLLGTVYQNTSGELMFLAITWSNTADPRTITVNTGAANPPAEVACLQTSALNNGAWTLFVPVMDGEYYEVSVDNAANVSVDDWREYTLDTVSAMREGDLVSARVPDKRYFNSNTGHPNISGAVKLIMVTDGGNGTTLCKVGRMIPGADYQQLCSQPGGRNRFLLGVCLPEYCYTVYNDSGASPSHWFEWMIG